MTRRCVYNRTIYKKVVVPNSENMYNTRCMGENVRNLEGFMKKVAIIMGSDSDLNAVKPAALMLRKLEIPFAMRVISAHRTPDAAMQFARGAAGEGFGVLIAAAGKAAHLAGAMAANSELPVIGIPIKSSTLDGLDALLSTVQMPSGMPVATVAIDGAQNAAILAAQILALGDEALAARVRSLRAEQTKKVIEKDEQLQKNIENILEA